MFVFLCTCIKLFLYLCAWFFFGEGVGACVERQTLLDLKVKEKKNVMAELEGEPQNHLEGVGVVIHSEVSLSDNDEDLTTGTPHSRTNPYVGTLNIAHARNPNLTKNVYIRFCLEMQIFDCLNINYSPTDNTSRPEYTNICLSVKDLMWDKRIEKIQYKNCRGGVASSTIP